MAEVKLNILICGVTSDSSLLFISLYNFLKISGHDVKFFIPEYSGAVCLIEKKIPFTRLNQVESESRLDSDDYQLLESCLKYDFKQIEIFSTWLKRIMKNRVLNDGKRLFNAYKKYLEDFKVDLIILWGGIRYYSSIPAAIAKKSNIKCIFIEKGLFPFTLQVDKEGVNASSQLKINFASVSTKTENYSLEFYQTQLRQSWFFSQPLNDISTQLKTKYLIEHYGLVELFIKLYHKYFETKLFKKFTYKDNWKVTDPTATSELIVDYEYIFIPFQVSDDSQLLIQGNWIKDNLSLVKCVYNSLREIGSKVKILVKEHPREYINYNYREILKKYDVQYSNGGTIDLIMKSKLIVSINSTVGFEALVFNKPVVITGNAIYESIPFIFKVNNQQELTLSLRQILNSDLEFEESEVHKYVSTVYNNLTKCNYISPSETELENLCKYIYELYFSKN